MLGAAEALGPVDGHHVGADPVDAGAHLRQQPRQVLYVGLAGGVGDLRRPRAERGCHQRVLGPHHRGLVHEDLAGAEAVGSGELDPAAAVDPGAEVLEGVEVGIEAAAADEVPTRRRHPRLAEAGEQRAREQERGANPRRRAPRRRRRRRRPRAQSRTLLSATQATSTPSCSSRAICASVSRIRGTRCSSTSSSVSRQAARIGSAAFLLPATVSSPESGTPPWITNFSIVPARVTTVMGRRLKIGIGGGRGAARAAGRSTRWSSTAKTEAATVTVPGGRILNLPGGEMQVVEGGPRDGAPIVLIHCFSCAIDWWDGMRAAAGTRPPRHRRRPARPRRLGKAGVGIHARRTRRNWLRRR